MHSCKVIHTVSCHAEGEVVKVGVRNVPSLVDTLGVTIEVEGLEILDQRNAIRLNTLAMRRKMHYDNRNNLNLMS